MSDLSFNERLFLSHLRWNGALPKTELARLTGLSPTAASSLIRQLETKGLVRRGRPQRGKVGQPSVPYSLRSEGSYAFGLKIGRRSVELVLLDATMRVVSTLERRYAIPQPDAVLDFACGSIARMRADLSPDQQNRICGLGVAMPFDIWNWTEEMAIEPGALDAWRSVDPGRDWMAATGLQIDFANDATAACAAEHALRSRLDALDLIYVFVGWFVGGGVIIDGKVYEGRNRNAGAIGSMPVGDGGHSGQLIRLASLFTLERELAAGGYNAERMWDRTSDWSDLGAALDNWLERAANGIARAIASAASVVDFQAAVIDGSMPTPVRTRLTRMIRHQFDRIDRQGLSELSIEEGSVGRSARAVGAACLPLLKRFAVDQNSLIGQDRKAPQPSFSAHS